VTVIGENSTQPFMSSGSPASGIREAPASSADVALTLARIQNLKVSPRDR